MRVLMVNRDDAFTVPGGDTVQMVETARELEGHGVAVHMTTLSEIPHVIKSDLVHLFNWEQLERFLAIRKQSGAGSLPLLLSPILWQQSAHWYDAAISSSPRWHRVHRAVGGRLGRTLYTTWQDHKFKRGAGCRRLRECLSQVSHLLPNSSTEVQHLRKIIRPKGEVMSNCAIVPNGVNRSLYDPRPQPDLSFHKTYGLSDFVLQVGRIQTAKNQIALIRALYDLTLPIVFVGQPSPYEPDYVERCIELGRQRGNVLFLGQFSPARLPGIYRLAGVHVLPSYRETPGLATLEAAAAGCKVVSTEVGSAREYFGNDAWYCNPHSPASIRKAVVNALRARRTDSLRQRVLSRYTWAQAAQVTIQAYHEVVRSESDKRQELLAARLN